MTKTPTAQTNSGTVVAATIIVVVGALAILGVIVYFAIQSAAFIGSQLSSWGTEIDPEIMAVIVGSILTFAITKLSNMIQDRRQTIQQMSLKKLETYIEFMSHFARTIGASEQQNESVSKNDDALIASLAVQLVAYGGNDVIKAYKEWKVVERRGNVIAFPLVAGNLLMAIRKDLGMNNKGLSGEELLHCIYTR